MSYRHCQHLLVVERVEAVVATVIRRVPVSHDYYLHHVWEQDHAFYIDTMEPGK